MESLEGALSILLSHAKPVTDAQELPLLDALNRIAAEDVVSPMNVPPFNRSPLDGYALHSEDIADASREHPAVVRVIGEACAGCGEVFRPGAGRGSSGDDRCACSRNLRLRCPSGGYR